MKTVHVEPDQTVVVIVEPIAEADVQPPADPRFGPYFRKVCVPLDELWRDGMKFWRRGQRGDTEYISALTHPLI